jgi:hypothetical protein
MSIIRNQSTKNDVDDEFVVDAADSVVVAAAAEAEQAEKSEI